MKKTRKAAKKRPKSQTRSRPKSTARPKRAERPSSDLERGSATSELLRELTEHHGGDVDADGQRAQSSGEEAVGGSVATPDQDIVDELARPLGVERPPNAQVITSDEILSARDRRRWRTEQQTDEEARDADRT